METKEIIKRLAEPYVASGCEKNVFSALKEMLEPHGEVYSDKGNDMSQMVPLILEKVKLLVLNGATADKIYEAVTSNENYAASGLKIKKTDTMQNALEIAKNSSEAGDIVSLCPACPAFDQFKTFEYRGRAFKQLVNDFKD